LIASPTERGGDDPIFALNAEATRRARAGEDVLNSTLGTLMDEEGRIAVLPSVCEAFRRIGPERTAGYAPIAGPPAFLDAVVRDVFGPSALAGSTVAVATPGGSGALYLAVTSFLEPGQSLLTSSFYWSPYQTIAQQTGRGLETFDMFSADGGLNVHALERALERDRVRQGRTLLFLNTPCHNPTGYSLDERDWTALVPVLERAAERTRLTVLVDVAYARYAPGDPARWIAWLEPLCGAATLLVAWSASKSFAQYGARVGACLAVESDAEERERTRAALGHACRGTWSNCNHLGMLAVTECLTDAGLAAAVQRERGALRELLAERARRFTELARTARLVLPRYEGGFFVTVFTPDPERTAAAMRQRGVYVVPIPGAVRVALCSTPLCAVPRLVEALAHGVRAAQERPT
jgi:aromatic-amino-acid transaminase